MKGSLRVTHTLRRTILPVLAFAALGWSHSAGAGLPAQRALAAKYAPVVRLVTQPKECGPGEPYRPLDVNLLFGADTVVAARSVEPDRPDCGRPDGIADREGLCRLSPRLPGQRARSRLRLRTVVARDLRGVEADRLRACRHRRRSSREARVAVLALLRLQRLEQPTRGRLGDDPAQLRRADGGPGAADESRRGRLQPARGRRARPWGDSKLELVDGTHPVVHVAAGSHANFFDQALYLGSSASEGVGCDDTRAPAFDIRPVVQTIPSDP